MFLNYGLFLLLLRPVLLLHIPVGIKTFKLESSHTQSVLLGSFKTDNLESVRSIARILRERSFNFQTIYDKVKEPRGRLTEISQFCRDDKVLESIFLPITKVQINTHWHDYFFVNIFESYESPIFEESFDSGYFSWEHRVKLLNKVSHRRHQILEYDGCINLFKDAPKYSYFELPFWKMLSPACLTLALSEFPKYAANNGFWDPSLIINGSETDLFLGVLRLTLLALTLSIFQGDKDGDFIFASLCESAIKTIKMLPNDDVQLIDSLNSLVEKSSTSLDPNNSVDCLNSLFSNRIFQGLGLDEAILWKFESLIHIQGVEISPEYLKSEMLQLLEEHSQRKWIPIAEFQTLVILLGGIQTLPAHALTLDLLKRLPITFVLQHPLMPLNERVNYWLFTHTRSITQYELGRLRGKSINENLKFDFHLKHPESYKIWINSPIDDDKLLAFILERSQRFSLKHNIAIAVKTHSEIFFLTFLNALLLSLTRGINPKLPDSFRLMLTSSVNYSKKNIYPEDLTVFERGAWDDMMEECERVWNCYGISKFFNPEEFANLLIR